MLSRQLPTRPLPVAPVPIGYCGRNHRFVLRIYFHIEQSLEPHLYFTHKPYSSSKRGFCVREVVAAWTRNVRATARPAGRGLVQSTPASSPKPVRIRASTVSTTSPRPCLGHARIRVRGQSMSVRSRTSRGQCHGLTVAADMRAELARTVCDFTATNSRTQNHSWLRGNACPAQNVFGDGWLSLLQKNVAPVSAAQGAVELPVMRQKSEVR